MGDDELVLAGMDEGDAAKFHALRFKTAQRRRADKLAAEAAEKEKAKLRASNAGKAAGKGKGKGTKASAGRRSAREPVAPVNEEEEEEEESESEESDDSNDDSDDDDVVVVKTTTSPVPAKASAKASPTAESSPAAESSPGGEQSSSPVPAISPPEPPADKEPELGFKEEASMETFLRQLFLPAEAACYAAIIEGLGVTLPKDLAAVTQDMLTSAGIKKFHARKIGSAEIYRAFL